MVRSGIGLNFKLGLVIMQNIVPGRDNGITAVRYINQAMKPHRNYTFQEDNAVLILQEPQ